MPSLEEGIVAYGVEPQNSGGIVVVGEVEGLEDVESREGVPSHWPVPRSGRGYRRGWRKFCIRMVVVRPRAPFDGLPVLLSRIEKRRRPGATGPRIPSSDLGSRA